MAADAMDWHPTTPPAVHNPYSHPQYMPGGWPSSPPPFRYTTGVFAVERDDALLERGVKRVCRSVWSVGAHAVLSVKPIYRIIRDWKDQRREAARQRHRQRRRLSEEHSATLPTEVDAQIVEADRILEEKEERQEQVTRRATKTLSAYTNLNYLSQSDRSTCLAQIDPHSPSATSVTNTETTITSPSTVKTTGNKKYKCVTGTDPKRRMLNEAALSSIDDRYANLNDYLEAQSKAQLLVPVSTNIPLPKKMRGVNRFDADQKPSPTIFGGRNALKNVSLKPIGVKVEEPREDGDVWGVWQHEKPIGMSPSDATQQLQSKLDFHTTGKEVVQSHQPQELGSRLNGNAVIAPHQADESEVSFDERWSTTQPMDIFYQAEDLQEEMILAKESTSEVKEEPNISGAASYFTSFKRLFFRDDPTNTPPVIKNRAIISKEHTDDTRQARDADLEIKHEAEAGTIDQVRHEEIDMAVKEEQNTEMALADLPGTGNSVPIGLSAPEPRCDLSDDQKAPVPITPMKVIAQKPAKYEPKTPTIAKQSSFETPAEKLSRLNIEDGADNDTPKATPHSGTKTTRVTRYREALEKAQKAKLEQYELVSISGEWDRKVRHAVRSGIPDLLGPHDLARVVPQYASRGQDNWLNDETINKYLELVAAHGRKNDRPEQVYSHHAFNNFFYNNLRSKGAASVARWSKRAKIGGKSLAYVEKVFVPINSGAHWTLAVVEPTAKKITHYNSMRGTGTGIRACEDLKNWVAAEQGKDFKEEEWTMIAAGESPQQTNSDDCGVFTITSARQIMLGYTPMSYGPAQIPIQRIRIVAELINKGLLKSSVEE